MSIDVEWDLGRLLGYVSTWSAVRRAREDGREHLLTGFAADLAALWGEAGTARASSFPIAMRLGTVE
jgi:hypothetical protein